MKIIATPPDWFPFILNHPTEYAESTRSDGSAMVVAKQLQGWLVAWKTASGSIGWQKYGDLDPYYLDPFRPESKQQEKTTMKANPKVQIYRSLALAEERLTKYREEQAEATRRIMHVQDEITRLQSQLAENN